MAPSASTRSAKGIRLDSGDNKNANTPIAFENLAERLYKTGQYSDLEVQCKGFSAKAHKAVVCTQSEWFVKAVAEGRFLEGTTNVIAINEDNPVAVQAMLQFLYTGDYCLESIAGKMTNGEHMLV